MWLTQDRYYQKLIFADKVMYILCYFDCIIDMHGTDNILTTGTASRILDCSAYKVRKVLKEYEQQGLVKRVCAGGCSDEELFVWCIKGWMITSQVRKTDIYKRANWHQAKCMRECWDIVPSQYYATCTAQWHERMKKKDYETCN